MASTNRSERVRFRYGICLNDSCTKCKTKEVQQISAHKEFVCAECGKALRECPPPRPSFLAKYWKLILGVVVMLLLVILALFIIPGISSKSDTQNPIEQPSPQTPIDTEDEDDNNEDDMEAEEVNVTQMTFMETESDMQMKPGAEKNLNIDCEPGNANEEILWTSSDESVATVSENGLVKAVTAGTSIIKAVATRSNVETSIKVTVKKEKAPVSDGGGVKNGNGHLELGYASYDGDFQNGRPHGNGTLTYKQSHKILSSKDYVASPGEQVIGNFANGELRMGTWYKNDGNQVVVKK